MTVGTSPSKAVRAHTRSGQADVRRVGALDGLRGIALLAVLVYHAAPNVLPGGFLGVEMFFVLSGFLLTWILLDEHRRTGAIDKIGYAARRMRRIFPGLLVLLTALAVIGRFIAPEDADRLAGDIVSSALGLTNWHLVREGSSYFANVGRPPLVRHLWSIAVELQAYVVLPFVAMFIARRPRRVAIGVLAAGIWGTATLMALLYVSPDPFRAYYGTDTRIGALLTGALVATVVAHSRSTASNPISSRGITVFGTLAGVILVASFVFVDERGGFLYPTGFLIVQAATAGLIALALRPGMLTKGLDHPALRWFGARSYGIYLWHWPLVVLTGGTEHPRPLEIVVTAAIAIALGDLSYRYIERPVMTRSGWARRPLPRITKLAAPVWAAGTTALVVLLASTAPAVDPIEESLLAGERALAAQDEETAAVDPEITEQRVVPGTNASGEAAPTKKGKVPTASGPKKGTVKLAAVGDSVMLGAAGRMKSRFGKAGYIDAAKNRRFSDSVDVVKKLSKKKRLGPVLIVHLGNNGPARKTDVDALMKQTKNVEHVLLVTIRVNRSWQESNNDVFKDAEKRHKKVTLVNWYRTSKGHDDWFYSDGTHMNPKGAEAYTKLMAASIPEPKKAKPTPTPTPKPTPTPGLLDPVIDPA